MMKRWDLFVLSLVGAFFVAAGAPAAVSTTGDVWAPSLWWQYPVAPGAKPDPWNTFGELVVGDFDAGALDISLGGVVDSTQGIIGMSALGVGTATVTGTNSRWNINSDLLVGQDGDGTLVVTDGGRVGSLFGPGIVGLGLDSVGDATISGTGSIVELADELVVGYEGSGTVSVETGGTVKSNSGMIGLAITSSGTVTVTGPNTEWMIGSAGEPGGLAVADGGTGHLQVEGGGEVASGDSWIGGLMGANGTVSITGSDSRWDNQQRLIIGGSLWGGVVAAGGSGVVEVTEGGHLSVNDTLQLFGGGELLIDGGTVTTGSFDNVASGLLQIDEGTLTVNGATGYFDPGTNAFLFNDDGDLVDGFVLDGGFSGKTAELVITGGASGFLPDKFVVGNVDRAVLRIEAGSTVFANDSVVADGGASTGQVMVMGTGARWNQSGHLTIGEGGVGELSIEAGGVVNSKSGKIGVEDSGGLSEITITGLGSSWLIEESLVVGLEGSGGVLIEAGGAMQSVVGTIAHSDGSDSQVSVTGSNSKWTNSGTLVVGDGGNGELTLDTGGQVANTYGFVGKQATAIGFVTVSGNGTRWDNIGDLSIGKFGNGTLNIENGGSVTNDDGDLGERSGSSGTVKVTGVGSSWESSGRLTVGAYGGMGALNVEAGGVVVAGVPNNPNRVGVGGSGTVTIKGAGSKWANLGDLFIGTSGGSGMVSVTDGGSVSVSGETRVFSGSTLMLSGAGSHGEVSDDIIIHGLLEVEDAGVISSEHGDIEGTVMIRGAGSQWMAVDDSIWVGGILDVADGGQVLSQRGTVSGGGGVAMIHGADARWNITDKLVVGYGGNGELRIEAGGTVSNHDANLGIITGSNGSVTVGDAGSVWNLSGELAIGSYAGSGTLTIQNSGRVNVTSTTAIGGGGGVNVFGGRLSGGGGTVGGRLYIGEFGQVMFSQNLANQSAGEIDNAGGLLDVEGTLSNLGGMISGHGQFDAEGGWQNTGSIVLRDVALLTGEFTNAAGGVVRTEGGATTQFAHDVIHNGAEMYTDLGSMTEILGTASGSGSYTGEGTVLFTGGLDPGNSPATVSFGGDVVLGSVSATRIELAGTELSAFDQLLVAGHLQLGGHLILELIDGFVPTSGDSFVLFDAGSLSGSFASVSFLPAEDSSWDLSDLYSEGSISLSGAVPEPAAILLALVGLALLPRRRRR